MSAVSERVDRLRKMAHEPTVAPGGPGLWGMKGKQLPAYIQHVFNDLVESGHPHESHTYRLAVGIVENWAEGHDGKGNKVSAETQAKAAAAVAEWEKLRAEAKMTKAKLTQAERDALPDSDFAIPSKRECPIHDISHARAALSMCANKPEYAKVKARVHARYPSLKKSRAEQVAKSVELALS